MQKSIDFHANVLWDYHHLDSVISKADIIIGLGSYDLRVAEYCAHLWQNRLANIILFTGSFGNWTSGVFSEPEAQIFKKHAISFGVPEEKILTEEQATNIGSNIEFSKRLFAARNLHIKKALIVTKPNTERRVFATSRKIWTEAEIIITSPQLTFNEQAADGLTKENLINELVGDLQRILIYPSLGFQLEQEVPDEVLESYHELVRLGFTRHLLKDS